MNRSYKNFNKKAFSLIELSVVLVIMAVLVAGSLSVSVSAVNNAKAQATNAKIKTIYQAMGAFLLKNYRLPCPANLTLAKTTAAYGAEIGSAGACSGTGVYLNNNHSEVAYGMVPTAALGLPTDMAEDAYGNKFAYVVNVKFTKSDGYPTVSTTNGFSFYAVNGTDMIEIIDQPSSTVTDGIMFAILSLGQNKSGAFTSTSTTQDPVGSSDVSEAQNYPTNISGSTADFGVVSGQGTRVVLTSAAASADVFDDYVFYKSRANMILDFNAMFLTPCVATSFNGHSYANAFAGSVVYSSTGNCATPNTTRPAYACGPNGVWTMKTAACSVY